MRENRCTKGGRAMKKRIVISLVTGFFLLAGCGSENPSDTLYNDEVIIEVTEETETVATVSLEEEVTLEGEASSNLIDYEGESYTWEDVTLIIPSAWKDKYVIVEEANGFSFYQKASYEVEESLGYLCGIYKNNTYSNTGAGDTLLAYTADGMCYYLMQPTDVNCYMDDVEIINEYCDMIELVNRIAGSVEIASGDIYYDVNQHVIPVSSIMKLQKYHVENLSDNELWIARNEIYARHGKVFKNEYLQSYFNARSWYVPKEGKNDVSERELSEVEIANLDLIVAAEASFDISHPYPISYEAESTVSIDLMNNGEVQDICYEVGITEDEYRCILTINDKEYRLNSYVDIITPEIDLFYVTDISQSYGNTELEDGLEIAVLDYGMSDDLMTHFFKYNGSLYYIGTVDGHPFAEESYLNGFSNESIIVGQGRIDLIETAYIDNYYSYDRSISKIEPLEGSMYLYKWFNSHELYLDMPVYYSMDEESPVRILKAQEEVYFIKTDGKEWIFVQGKDGTEGYIRVKNGNILNLGLPAQEVFSDLNFFG